MLIKFLDNREDYYEFVRNAINVVVENYNNTDKSKDLEANLIICHNTGHRFIKSLIIEYQNYQNDTQPLYFELVEKIYEIVQQDLSLLIQTKAIFIIIAFIEFTDYKDQVRLTLIELILFLDFTRAQPTQAPIIQKLRCRSRNIEKALYVRCRLMFIYCLYSMKRFSLRLTVLHKDFAHIS
jgi:hypothetical protein